jgi:putative ABC transport system permease protein
MNFLSGIRNGLQEIWGHKLRSFLTLFCVMLGVSSLVLVNGFIDGLFRGWVASMNARGGLERIQVMPKPVKNELRHLSGVSSGLTEQDALRIAEFCPEIQSVSPEIKLDPATLRYRGKTERANLYGGLPEVFHANRFELEQGRALVELDQAQSTQVIVLGEEIVSKLFDPGEPVLGKTVELRGVPFLVVGVLEKYEELMGDYNLLGEKNRSALIPLSTLQTKVQRPRQLTRITLRIPSPDTLAELTDRVTNVLFQLHRGVEDFEVRTNEESLASFQSTKRGFVLAGGGIGAISLLVSGIGIMNLMLASIHERVREIGLRKAIGAWGRDIFVQFLVEALTLGLLGGVFGVALGIGGIELLQGIGEFRPQLSWSAVGVGFGFSVVVGLAAGVYPAFKASRLDPIDALRYD